MQHRPETPTAAETPPLASEVLGRVRVEEPLVWRNLQVFPLVWANGHDATYAPIDDLLERGEAEIGEVGDGGAVPVIEVRNHSTVDALILDGSELRGAKQNRMVNVTIIAAHGTATPVPVSCVEAGRWAYRSRRFASSKRTVVSRLRNLKAQHVAASLAGSGRAAADQGEVWERVHTYLGLAGAASATEAMDDAFTRHAEEVETFGAHLGSIDAYGAAVALNGEIVSVDLFDHRDTFGKLWGSLLRGYAMDAILEDSERSAPLTREAAERWLGELAAGATLAPHAVPGVGRYYALEARGVAGGMVTHQGRVVHVALFPAAAAAR